MLASLPKEIIEYVIPSDDNCPKCGNDLKVIGKEHVRTEVKFIPAKLLIKQIVRQVAKCIDCGKKKVKIKHRYLYKHKYQSLCLHILFQRPL